MREDVSIKSTVDIPEEIYMEAFTPMEERIKGTDLEEPFLKLKDQIEENDFNKYFNTLSRIKRHEKDMLMVTHSENYRAIIIRQYFELLKEIFEVSKIMIIAQ